MKVYNMENLSAISAAILVLITAYYTYLTNKILKSQKESNEELFRPYIVMDFVITGMIFQIYIKNIGKRPAYNLNIEPSNSFSEFIAKGIDITPFLAQHSIFPPNEKKKFFLNRVDNLSNAISDKKINSSIHFKISYNYKGKKDKITEDIDFNLENMLKQKGIINKYTIDYIIEGAGYLGKINKNLENIAKSIKNNN